MKYLKKSLDLYSLLDALGIKHKKISNKKINAVGSLFEEDEEIITFSKNKYDKLDKQAIVLAPLGSPNSLNIIPVNNPRLEFAKLLLYINENSGFKNTIKKSIHKTVKIGKNVKIGDSVFIDRNTIIKDNVIINNDVYIGENCVIHEGSIIGKKGFGFVRDDNQVPIKILHLGSVHIMNNVEIGSLVSINKATLDKTIIEKNVKIDDHCHLAHNVKINENTIICSGATIGGSCEIGKNCFIGLNSTIHQKIRIFDNVTIGMGANVFSSAKKDSTLAGYPSKRVPNFKNN